MNDVFQVLLTEMNLDFYTKHKDLIHEGLRKRRQATSETPPLTNDEYWSKGELT